MTDDPTDRHLVLASGSPRRRLLLASAGYTFSVVVPDIDESPSRVEAPIDTALRLATEKAATVADRVARDDCVLGLDTIVVLDGGVLGKPRDAADAVAMLEALGGRTHTVFTAYAAVVRGAGLADAGVEATEVTMRPISRKGAEEYVAHGESLDKAGAYAYQGLGRGLIERVAGSRSNVVGLPLVPVVDLLRRMGVPRDSRRGRPR